MGAASPEMAIQYVDSDQQIMTIDKTKQDVRGDEDDEGSTEADRKRINCLVPGNLAAISHSKEDVRLDQDVLYFIFTTIVWKQKT